MSPAFEIVHAPGGARLARVHAPGPAPSGPVLLTVRENGDVRRLRPLPDPSPGGDRWQAAYALAPAVDLERARFALELPDGSVTDLPAPRARRVGRPVGELTAAYAAARRERDEAVRAARAAEAEGARAAELAAQAEAREREHRALADSAAAALARAEAAGAEAERRARGAE